LTAQRAPTLDVEETVQEWCCVAIDFGCASPATWRAAVDVVSSVRRAQ